MSGNQVSTGQRPCRRIVNMQTGKRGRDGPNRISVRECAGKTNVIQLHLTDSRVNSCGTGLEGKRIGKSPPGARGVFLAANDNDWTTERFKDGRPVRLGCFVKLDGAAERETFSIILD